METLTRAQKNALVGLLYEENGGPTPRMHGAVMRNLDWDLGLATGFTGNAASSRMALTDKGRGFAQAIALSRIED